MDDDEVPAVVRALARYLRAHPRAGDSAIGIARWWLQPEDEVSMDALMRALDWLKDRGVLEEAVGADCRIRFRRCGDDAALDAALARLDERRPR